MSMENEPQLVIRRSRRVGRIELNRPRALNSLTIEMVRGFQSALDDFEQDSAVSAVLVTGRGDRGLCAGGDIRAIYDSGRADGSLAAAFWREEYVLDARISHFPKPYIAVLDGITMGGGVGISAHGKHRIVTERTQLAMPETGIGYFPDVGATWLLSRGPGEYGTHLALTGERIGAADAIQADLADIFVPSSELVAFEAALCSVSGTDGGERMGQIVQQFSRPPPPATVASCRSAIDRLFAFDDMEAIIAALDGEKTEFAKKTSATLLSKSPTSLKLTLRMLRLGRESVSLEQCLEREFLASLHMLANPDFYEGIRAAVIDKDRNPRWSPDNLAAVGRDAIEGFLGRPSKQRPLFPEFEFREE